MRGRASSRAADKALADIFNTFDTSGDGALDADELKVALRVAIGIDLPSADCQQLVLMADKDGTGTVDFDEFRVIVRRQI